MGQGTAERDLEGGQTPGAFDDDLNDINGAVDVHEASVSVFCSGAIRAWSATKALPHAATWGSQSAASGWAVSRSPKVWPSVGEWTDPSPYFAMTCRVTVRYRN